MNFLKKILSTFASNRLITVFLKASFTCILIAWLIDSGKLDFNQLTVFKSHLYLLIAIFTFWLTLGIFSGSFRWYYLIKGIGLKPKLTRTIQLTMVGLFFNTFMPGAVGGDLVKGIYIIREQEKAKTAALLTVFLDRVFGLFGLFTIATIGILADYSNIFTIPQLVFPASFTICIFIAFLTLLLAILFPTKLVDSFFITIINKNLFFSNFIDKTYSALIQYRTARIYLLYAWIFSIIIQGGIVAIYWNLTSLISNSEISFSNIAAVVPIGLLLSAIPLAPGGLGVGHVAFDKLYSLIQIQGGANIFNVVFLIQILVNLCGFLPYLMFRSQNQNKQVIKTTSFSSTSK
ncbi:MAG: lysylphosphatidylglycerol synthase transmembrane domain-containing protein [Bdellovibrionota bacterium]